jgi:hypothetical protein
MNVKSKTREFYPVFRLQGVGKIQMREICDEEFHPEQIKFVLRTTRFRLAFLKSSSCHSCCEIESYVFRIKSAPGGNRTRDLAFTRQNKTIAFKKKVEHGVHPVYLDKERENQGIQMLYL